MFFFGGGVLGGYFAGTGNTDTALLKITAIYKKNNAASASASFPPINVTHSPSSISRQLPRCKLNDGQHLVGAWREEPISGNGPHPPCCGWDATALPWRPAANSSLQCGKNYERRWDGSTTALMRSGGHGCSCDAVRAEKIQRVDWVPRDCALDRWNATAFCKALGRRKIMFVGDSTSGQVAASVHNYIAIGGGICSHQISSVLSDFLASDFLGPGVHDRGDTWNSTVLHATPDIVILGLGPHIGKQLNYTRILLHIRSVFITQFGGTPLRLLWRTTTGAGCGPTILEQSPNAPSGRWPPAPGMPWVNRTPYNWGLMEEWDNIAVQVWRDVPGAAVLDMRPLWLRPDAAVGRGDCVHVCLPGPFRFAARLLLHELIGRNNLQL